MKTPHLRVLALLGVGVLELLWAHHGFSQSTPASSVDTEPAKPWEETVQADNINSVVFITFTGKDKQGMPEAQTGTGFIVSADGFLLTCLHVLPAPYNYSEYMGTVVIGARQGTEYRLTRDDYIDKEEDLDLVLFRLPDNPAQWRSIQRVKMRTPAHTSIMGLGFPLEEGLVYAKGEITSLRAKKASHWLTDAPLNKGMSGGPVFDKTGAVVAIVAAGYPTAQRISELIPIVSARSFLENYGSPVLTQQSQAVQKSAEEFTKAAEKIDDTKATLAAKQLDSEDSAKVNELLQKGSESEASWLALNKKFAELLQTQSQASLIRQRQNLIDAMRENAKTYREVSETVSSIAENAPEKPVDATTTPSSEVLPSDQPIRVLGTQHRVHADGRYFDFDSSDLDAILGRQDWNGQLFFVSKRKDGNYRLAVMWRRNNGGPGSAHGRYDPIGKANDWQAGDSIFVDPRVRGNSSVR